uniref:7TM_GPCR_Srx domain-containing protein n=1 Tax=Caenorhabditis tropicalis TaxID=1561998 RepID=A0A1I7U2H8_9PELO
MAVFSSLWDGAYIQIPYDKMPFRKVNGYVIVIGIIHIWLAETVFRCTTRYLECGSLLLASFFFSVDLYCLFTVDSYVIRKHCRYEWESTLEKGIIRHVGPNVEEKPITLEVQHKIDRIIIFIEK